MVYFLNEWKKRTERRKRYRRWLMGILLASVIAFAGVGLYQIDSRIPSTLMVRAGEEQRISLRIPATGNIVAVDAGQNSNIPTGQVKIDLQSPIYLKTGRANDYRMEVCLFGFLPLKQVDIKVLEDTKLTPVGVPIGIYMKTNGVLVVGVGNFISENEETVSPASQVLKTGDYVREINHRKIETKEELVECVENCGGSKLVLSIERDGILLDEEILPVKNKIGNYKLGIWIRDNAQGVGTMTYIDEKGRFGALGHGINDVDTSLLMDMDDGTLYETKIVAIRKGADGQPGEMTGVIAYSNQHILGDIDCNSARGVFGQCNEKALQLTDREALPVAYKQEITLGPAKILCTIEGETEEYDVEITRIHLEHDNINRGLELTVTDEKLLQLTGGIVQGMSGAPILQNGKIIGAVTHVLINDSKKGYGIFIENMLLP